MHEVSGKHVLMNDSIENVAFQFLAPRPTVAPCGRLTTRNIFACIQLKMQSVSDSMQSQAGASLWQKTNAVWASPPSPSVNAAGAAGAATATHWCSVKLAGRWPSASELAIS
jgi:hypothetical protein